MSLLRKIEPFSAISFVFLLLNCVDGVFGCVWGVWRVFVSVPYTNGVFIFTRMNHMMNDIKCKRTVTTHTHTHTTQFPGNLLPCFAPRTTKCDFHYFYTKHSQTKMKFTIVIQEWMADLLQFLLNANIVFVCGPCAIKIVFYISIFRRTKKSK